MKNYLEYEDRSDSPELNSAKTIILSPYDYEADTPIITYEEPVEDSKKAYAPFMNKTPKIRSITKK